MAKISNPVKQVIEKEGSVQALAERWGISREAIYGFERNGYFPLDRARDAAGRHDIPLRELVRPDIRAAMDSAVQDHLLSD